MTKDDIIRMAREAGFETLLPHEHIHGAGGVYVGDDDIAGTLERFAALVAAAEREACAKVCDLLDEDENFLICIDSETARAIAAVIRERGAK